MSSALFSVEGTQVYLEDSSPHRGCCPASQQKPHAYFSADARQIQHLLMTGKTKLKLMTLALNSFPPWITCIRSHFGFVKDSASILIRVLNGTDLTLVAPQY